MTPAQVSDRLTWLNANPACDEKVLTPIAPCMPVLSRDERKHWAIRIAIR